MEAHADLYGQITATSWNLHTSSCEYVEEDGHLKWLGKNPASLDNKASLNTYPVAAVQLF